MKELLEKLAKGETSVEDVLKAIDDNQKDYVPRSRLNDKNDEIKDLKDEIKQRDTQIDQLQQSAKGNEDLEKQLEDLKKSNDDWQTKYTQTQLNNAIKLAVAKEAKDANDILHFINKDGLELSEDGKVEGLDEALKGLKESKSYLFVEKEEPSLKGRKPNDSKETPAGLTKDQFNQMSYQERMDLYNKDLETYQKLTN